MTTFLTTAHKWVFRSAMYCEKMQLTEITIQHKQTFFFGSEKTRGWCHSTNIITKNFNKQKIEEEKMNVAKKDTFAIKEVGQLTETTCVIF